MKHGNVVMLLILAGVLSIVAALWSGWGYGLGPVQMGEGERITQQTRNLIMILAFVAAAGAFSVAALSKKLGRRVLGTLSLISAALLVPSLFQGNVLSIVSLILLVILGITFLLRVPGQESTSRG